MFVVRIVFEYMYRRMQFRYLLANGILLMWYAVSICWFLLVYFNQQKPNKMFILHMDMKMCVFNKHFGILFHWFRLLYLTIERYFIGAHLCSSDTTISQARLIMICLEKKLKESNFLCTRTIMSLSSTMAVSSLLFSRIWYKHQKCFCLYR